MYHCSGVEQPEVPYLLKQTEQLLKPRNSLLTESQHAAFPLTAAQLDQSGLRTKSDEHSCPTTPLNQRGKINISQDMMFQILKPVYDHDELCFCSERDMKEVHDCIEITHNTEECCKLNCVSSRGIRCWFYSTLIFTMGLNYYCTHRPNRFTLLFKNLVS